MKPKCKEEAGHSHIKIWGVWSLRAVGRWKREERESQVETEPARKP